MSEPGEREEPGTQPGAPEPSWDFDQLQAVCRADDPAGLSAWLAAHTDADSELRRVFLAKSAGGGQAGGDERASSTHTLPGPGTSCGPFILKERLGAGGTGEVFEAVRDDGFQQKVAVKVLHSLNPKVKTLFQRECRILAQLQHPYIAHLIETGELPSGQPWLAIEHIEGTTLDAYLETHKPNLSQRIRLAIKMCEAVSHAHQHMVIHRDLKPENVMITAEGNPKLLDFGIAVTFKPNTGEQSRETELGCMMTVRYASPEQIAGKHLKAASDVYSLGVVIYEMLTGALPYRVDRNQVGDLMQAVSLGQVVAPSRQATYNPNDGTVATRPSQRRLRGDVDTILLKALALDAEERYQSAEAFAQDLAAFEAGLPIKARPATRTYLLRKFVARNPLPTLFGGVFVASLVLFSFILSAKQREIQKEHDTARREKQTAETVTHFIVSMFDRIDPETSYGRDVTAYEVMRLGREQVALDLADEPEVQTRLYATIGRVYYSLGRFDESQELLDLAVKQAEPGSDTFEQASIRRLRLIATLGYGFEVEEELRKLEPLWEDKEEPLQIIYLRLWLLKWRGRYFEATRLYAEYQERLAKASFEDRAVFEQFYASVLLAMEEHEKAQALLERLLTRQEARYGADHFDVADTHCLLAEVGKGQADESRVLGHLDAAEALVNEIFDGDHPVTLRILHLRIDLALELNQLDKAEELLKKAETVGDRLFKTEHPYLALNWFYRGQWEIDKGRYEAAETSLRRAMTSFSAFSGEEGVRTHQTRGTLGVLFSRLGRHQEAEQVFRTALAKSIEMYGDDHPQMASHLNNLGLLLLDIGRNEEAERHLLRAYQIIVRSYGEKHARTALYANNLGLFYKNRGMFKKAEKFYREALVLRRELFGDDSPRTAVTAYNLAVMLHTCGDWTKAFEFYRQAFQSMQSAYGEEHEYTAITLNGRASLSALLGRFKEADRDSNEALALMRKLRGDRHPRTMGTLRSRGDIFHLSGDLTRAEQTFAEAVQVVGLSKLEKYRESAAVYAGMSKTLIEQGRFDEAASFVEKGKAITKDNPNTPISFTLGLSEGRVLLGQNRPTEAGDICSRELARAKGVLPANSSILNEIRLFDTALKAQRGDWDQAITMFENIQQDFLLSLPEDHFLRDFGNAVQARLGPDRDSEAAANQHRAACASLVKKLGADHYLVARAEQWPNRP